VHVSAAGALAFFTTCVLLPCPHGWVVGAGVLDCRPPPRSIADVSLNGHANTTAADPTHACDLHACKTALPLWWHVPTGAMRCPHGLCPWGAPFAGRCHPENCCAVVVAATRDAARSSLLDLPRRTDPIRWPGKIRLAIGAAAGVTLACLNQLAPPKALAHAWHEHSGSFREAWAAAAPQHHFISVADRPSCAPLSANALHVIAEVKAFFQWYPHPIPFLTSHWDCAPLTRANKTQPLRSPQYATAPSPRSSTRQFSACTPPVS
jgi:hypothetical protein